MHHLVLLIQVASDPVPSDNDVKAGWGALGVFTLLIVAVAFLCWSFVRQMRKVKAADEAGVYDEPGTRAESRQDSQPGTDQPGS